MRKIILWVFLFYQKVLSPVLPARCRFYPTCSQYSYDAVEQYGVIKGLHLSLKRILRCHPFNAGGYDPIK